MSKISTPLLIVLAIVAVAAIGGWRTSSGNYSTATTELINTSNKLAEATAKLAEQGAVNQTLRTQLDLHKADIAGHAGRLNSLNDRLTQETKRAGGLESIIGQRDTELRAANQNLARSAASIGSLESDAAGLRGELETVRTKLSESQSQFQSANSSLNAAQSEIALLLQKLNDPATLRAGLAEANKPSPVPGRPGRLAKLTLQPDGSVTSENAPSPKPVSPPKSQLQPQPVFKELPGIITP